MPPAAKPARAPAPALNLADLRKELDKLSTNHAEVLRTLAPGDAPAASDAAKPPPSAVRSTPAPAAPADPDAGLRAENERLRAQIASLEEKLANAVDWPHQEAAFEEMLHEKTETIRTLNCKVHELSDTLKTRKTAEDFKALTAKLDEREKRLQAEEAEMQEQLNEMEKALARERAELSRQRKQMQQLQVELQHEIESSNRDPQLQERLQALHRGTQERPKSVAPGMPAPAGEKVDDSSKSASFIRRMLG